MGYEQVRHDDPLMHLLNALEYTFQGVYTRADYEKALASVPLLRAQRVDYGWENDIQTYSQVFYIRSVIDGKCLAMNMKVSSHLRHAMPDYKSMTEQRAWHSIAMAAFDYVQDKLTP